LDETGRVNENGGPYAGQDRFEARKNLWEDMRALGLVIKEEPYLLNVPRSQRGGEIIEPMISTQWFVKMGPLAQAGLEAVRDGRVKIVPERFTKVYDNWLENIEDWCISRQLWWGHRIPVWYCTGCDEMIVSREDPTHCPKCESSDLIQDPDVLDTWFSSGLWPFSTLGWPEETPDYRYFYPTSILETGYDILFFWVARMIMSGLEFTGQAPFHTVYLHGLIRDENGKKMSKTYGNVIDPLVVMDELGTDALRFTLLVGSTPGNDMNLSLKKVEANRNFANKVWNAARFVIASIQELGGEEPGGEGKPEAGIMEEQTRFPEDWTLADAWINARLRTLVRDVERLFGNYQYGEAGRQIYDFFWGEFADWYLEIAKLQLGMSEARAFSTARILVRVLDTSLRLLHPFTPFFTEEIWGNLKKAASMVSPDFAPQGGWERALIVARWPETIPEAPWESQAIADFSLMMEVVRTIRNLRAEKNVNPGRKIPAVLAAGEATGALRQQAGAIAALANLDGRQLEILKSLEEKPEGNIALIVGPVEVYLPLAGLVDPAEERARLEKDLAGVESQVNRLEKLLASPFSERAPEEVVQKEREKLESYRQTQEKIKEQLASLAQ
jgi:valyl-tRNA synthetase